MTDPYPPDHGQPPQAPYPPQNQGPYQGPPYQGPYQGPPPQQPYQGPPPQGYPPAYQGPPPQQGYPPAYPPQQPYQGPPQGYPPQGPPPGYGPDYLAAPQPPPRRRRGLLIGAIAVVAVLGIAGGSYAALADHHDSSVDAAAAHIPADAVAAMSINIRPSGDEGVAALRFLRNFPSANVGAGNDLGDTLVRRLFNNEPGIDYDRDVKPWLGDHLTVAADPQDGTAAPVAALQVTDEGKARTALTRLAQRDTDKSGFVVQDGYAYLAESTSAARRAATDAQAHSLRDAATYRDDVDTLPDNLLANAWVDLKGAQRYLAQGQVNLPAGRTPDRMVAGLRFESSYADFQVKTFGGSAGLTTDVSKDVLRLPNDTAMAFAAGHLDRAIASYYQQLATSFNGRLQGPLQRFQQRSGLTLPGDLTALVGSRTVFALGGPQLQAIGLIATTDPDRALAAARKLSANALHNQPLSVRKTPSGLVIANTDQYAGRLARGGALGEQGRFQQAVPDARGAGFVAYVDIGRVVARMHNATGDTRHLAAFGATASTQNGSSTLHVRLVVQ